MSFTISGSSKTKLFFLDSFESTETNLEALRKRFDAEKRAVEELTKKVNQKDEDETQIAEELETVNLNFILKD
jgi:hypothetical protein